MALHFTRDEFAARLELVKARMKEEKLDALLIFAQESMYWLTGYDTFGYCFFQSLVVKADGQMVLLTRSADLRQAKHTSIIEDIRIWVDRTNADPALDLKNLLMELDLLGCRIGVEYDTHGLTGRNARMLDDQLTIACGDGAIRFVEVQRSGKRPMSAGEFRRGFQLPVGTTL